MIERICILGDGDLMMCDSREVSAFAPIKPFTFSELRFKGGGKSEVKETADQQALAQIMAERFAYYRNNYGKAEDEYMESVDRYKDPVVSDNAAGISASSSMDIFSDVLNTGKKQLTSAGIDPSSGAFQSAIDSAALQGGEIAAGNVARSRSAIDDEYIRGKSNIVAIGNGKETDAIAGFADIAASSGDRATEKSINKHNERSGNIYTAANIAGGATRAYMEDGA